LRRALPVGFLDDAGIMQILNRELQDLAGLLQREGSADEAFGMLQDDFVRLGRSAPDGQFVASLDRLRSIALNTNLVKRPHMYVRVITLGDSVSIQFSRSLVQGTAEYTEAMKFVAQRSTPFALGSLPGLDDVRKVSFATRLVQDGLLSYADAHDSRCSSSFAREDNRRH
jgi:hypothetical protein